jgi:polyisoprenoid-binding protein YceI
MPKPQTNLHFLGGYMTRHALFLMLASGLLLGQPSFGQKLEAEPNHTTIGFAIPIAELTRVTGKFTDFKISVSSPDDTAIEDVTGWTIEAEIATASIDTGIDARDRHLRQADFFDAETYPQIHFVSASVERLGDQYVAVGKLAMHGVTQPFRLPFTVTGSKRDRVQGALRIGISARMTLRRSDYNLAADFQHTYFKDFLGDEVAIEIDTWLQPPGEEREKAAQQ